MPKELLVQISVVVPWRPKIRKQVELSCCSSRLIGQSFAALFVFCFCFGLCMQCVAARPFCFVFVLLLAGKCMYVYVCVYLCPFIFSEFALPVPSVVLSRTFGASLSCVSSFKFF